MTHNEFNQLRHTITALPPDQLRQLRDDIDRELAEAATRPSLTEEEFKRQLLASGLMTSLPTPSAPATKRAFRPVRIEGEPLSETIIRERR